MTPAPRANLIRLIAVAWTLALVGQVARAEGGAPSAANDWSSLPATAQTMASDTLGWAVGAVSALPETARQGAWEFSYMFGFNRTPPERQASVPDAPVSADAALPTPEPVAQAPEPAPTPLPPVEQVAAAPEPASSDVDKGLLANFVFDRGNRRPDGSFFVPKSLQRLFNVRVAAVAEADVPPILRLTGRVIADPRAFGTVQAGFAGRLMAPEGGFVTLGAHVAKGDALAYVIPAVGVVDRTQTRREIARLTTEIRVETENLEILKQFRFVPFRDGKIYQSEQRLAGMRRERAALLPLLQTQEILRAPVDGVISVTRAVAGRLVQAGDAVYEIVSPTSFWVEAMAADPAAAAAAGRPVAASAITPDGQVLQLAYVGSGLALQQQSTPVMFRVVAPPTGLQIGRPVSLLVQGEGRGAHGIPITREAVTVGTDGIQEVWEQTEPEVFTPRAVRAQDIDGGRVLLVGGQVSPGVHVVVRGARMMAQLQ